MRRPVAVRFTIPTIAVWLALACSDVSATPDVVVSLKPLELLVRAVATDDTSVTTLVPPGANPHNFSMKPSQRRALSQADAVFWVGPKLEAFLIGLLNGDEFRPRSHALSTNGESGKPVGDDRHQEHSHHGDDQEDHSAQDDPHIWLDPALSREMARKIHGVLVKLPGADAMALNTNLARFEKALANAEADIHQQLEPARALSLFTYHNAFSHFAEHYDLTLAGVLTVNPDLSPGARHIAEVQNRLQKANRPCLMTEQPFDPQSWKTIVGDIDVAFSAWDPLASDIKPGPDAYIAFQKSLADAVLRCL